MHSPVSAAQEPRIEKRGKVKREPHPTWFSLVSEVVKLPAGYSGGLDTWNTNTRGVCRTARVKFCVAFLEKSRLIQFSLQTITHCFSACTRNQPNPDRATVHFGVWTQPLLGRIVPLSVLDVRAKQVIVKDRKYPNALQSTCTASKVAVDSAGPKDISLLKIPGFEDVQLSKNTATSLY